MSLASRAIVAGLAIYQSRCCYDLRWCLVRGDERRQYVECKVRTSLRGESTCDSYAVCIVTRCVRLISGELVVSGVDVFYCDCKAGMGKCKHLGAALCMYQSFSAAAALASVACTDVPCEWSSPSRADAHRSPTDVLAQIHADTDRPFLSIVYGRSMEILSGSRATLNLVEVRQLARDAEMARVARASKPARETDVKIENRRSNWRALELELKTAIAFVF